MSDALARIVRLGAVLRDEDPGTLGVIVKPTALGCSVHLVMYGGSGDWAQTARYATASSYDMACEALLAALTEEVEAAQARLTAALA